MSKEKISAAPSPSPEMAGGAQYVGTERWAPDGSGGMRVATLNDNPRYVRECDYEMIGLNISQLRDKYDKLVADTSPTPAPSEPVACFVVEQCGGNWAVWEDGKEPYIWSFPFNEKYRADSLARCLNNHFAEHHSAPPPAASEASNRIEDAPPSTHSGAVDHFAELCAVIFRDGGQHLAEVGRDKALDEAQAFAVKHLGDAVGVTEEMVTYLQASLYSNKRASRTTPPTREELREALEAALAHTAPSGAGSVAAPIVSDEDLAVLRRVAAFWRADPVQGPALDRILSALDANRGKS